MKSYKSALVAVLGGVVATLVTGIYNTTPSGLVGAAWYGFPTPWIRRLVLAPQYNPWRISPTGFVVDFVVWTIVIGIIVWSVERLECSKEMAQTTKKPAQGKTKRRRKR